MKKLALILLSIVSIAALSSCDKAEMGPVANTSDPGAPAINSPEDGQSYELNRDQAGDTVMTIQWSEPDYGFNSAPTYNVELGASSDFSNAQQIASTQKTSVGVTVGSLNQMLLTMALAGGKSHNVHLRVTASINTDSTKNVVSSPVTISVTPFQTSFPPIYMIGSALKGWSLDQAVVTPSTEPNVYSTMAEFTNGEAFRFFKEADWSAENWNYPYFADNGGTIDPMLENANDGDLNFRFTGSTGWYRITVNFDTYNVEMEAVDEPVMYMTGSGTGAWDTPGSGESVKMTFVQPGVFEATTDFQDGAFRFFGQAGWAPDSYNYPYFANNGGTIDELLENANDGDSNFQFTGSAGSYYIKVNINDYVVEMEAAN